MPDFSLTKEQVRFYDDNGYLVVEGVFNGQECNEWIAFFEGHANEKFSGIMNLDRESPKARELMTHPVIVRMLDGVQRAEVVGLQTMYLFKKAKSAYADQAWNRHQDNAYPQSPYGAYLTANIAFTDQYPENGCMFIYPGSHKLGLLPCKEKVRSFREAAGENPGHVSDLPPEWEGRQIDLLMTRGSVLILHGCVVHGSYPNKSENDRPMMLMPYITRGEAFIPGKVGKRMEIPLLRPEKAHESV